MQSLALLARSRSCMVLLTGKADSPSDGDVQVLRDTRSIEAIAHGRNQFLQLMLAAGCVVSVPVAGTGTIRPRLRAAKRLIAQTLRTRGMAPASVTTPWEGWLTETFAPSRST